MTEILSLKRDAVETSGMAETAACYEDQNNTSRRILFRVGDKNESLTF